MRIGIFFCVGTYFSRVSAIFFLVCFFAFLGVISRFLGCFRAMRHDFARSAIYFFGFSPRFFGLFFSWGREQNVKITAMGTADQHRWNSGPARVERRTSTGGTADQNGWNGGPERVERRTRTGGTADHEGGTADRQV